MTSASFPSPERHGVLKAVVASTVGTTIEWYDFFLYGTAAAVVFPHLFFPQYDPFTRQLLSYGTFTVGFIARPLGGVIFGYLGDRVGRKSSLVATLLLMGISTFLIGLLPTYDRIGLLAPLLLTILRAMQGIGVGGEWGGAVLLAVESGHSGRRGFYASLPQAGVPLGLLASTGVVALCRGWLGEAEFLAWGWRVPFFLSALLIVVGLLIRATVREPALFSKLQLTAQTSRAPVREVIGRHWREILLVAGARLVENSIFYLFTVHVLTFAVRGEIVKDDVLRAVNYAAMAGCVAMPLFGVLSDFVSRKAVYVAACLFTMAFAWPYYALVGAGDVTLLTLAVIVSLALPHAALYSVQGSLIPELFGTRLRYSGSSIGYQLAGPFAGGLAPIVATWLARAYPGSYWPLAGYVMLLGTVSLGCVLLLAETSRRRLDDSLEGKSVAMATFTDRAGHAYKSTQDRSLPPGQNPSA